MDEEVMARFSSEEQVFWVCFFQEAEGVIERMEALGKIQPFDPPASLRDKYRMALERYNGSVYCQVRQLEAIFNFNSDVPASGGNGVYTFLSGMAD